jgi:hypothetical protein
MENKDKILMADGSIINRIHFLQDLKVGDELIGYTSYWGKSDQYVVDSIGRKYATLKRGSNEYKMSLNDGIFHYKDLNQFNITFFKTQEELSAYLNNLKCKKEVRDILRKLDVSFLDIEKVVKLKSLLEEL